MALCAAGQISGKVGRMGGAVSAAVFAAGYGRTIRRGLAALSPSYQTNDDAQIAMIAAGKGWALRRMEHLMFTNVLVGQVLKSLYTAWPAVAWYGVYLLVVQYLAQTVLLYCAICARLHALRVAMYLLFFATVGIFYLNNLQFTTTACLVGQSGAVACLVALRRATADRGAYGVLGVGIATLLLASIIRLDCFYLTALVALPPAICLVGWPLRREVLKGGASGERYLPDAGGADSGL